MSFLEYVCQQLIGPPLSGSCWRCPFCNGGNSSFSVRPPMANYPVKYKCFRCDAWGDEFDLLKFYFPNEDFSQRKERIARMEEAYQAGDFALSLRGPGSKPLQNPYDRDPRLDEFSDEADEGVGELLRQFDASPDDLLMVAKLVRYCGKALSICARHSLHPLGFAGRCEYEAWSREALIEHAAQCADDDCGNDCRKLRGLPPLPPKPRVALKRPIQKRGES